MKKRLGLIALCIGLLSGCGVPKDTTVVLTTGFQKDEVFRIEQESCTKDEYLIFLSNMKSQYLDSFGEGIFEVSHEGSGLEDTLKGQALERLAGIKSMKLLAKEKAITLDEEELSKVKEATTQYMQAFGEENGETVFQMYEELCLAQKVYNSLIADINPEISDDEARTITVQKIYVKTYFVNERGIREPISNMGMQECKERIERAYADLMAGADFATIAKLYSDDTVVNYSFGKGMVDPDLEELAFSLSQGEISEVFENKDGFYILKCITTFNKEETDRNKITIVENRRKEVFEQEYIQFATGLVRQLNEELMEEITLSETANASETNFFTIYEAVFN